MNDAIRIAIKKGGYKYGYGIDGDYETDGWSYEEIIDEAKDKVVLDPLFWKALARALSWEQYTEEDIGNWDEVNTMITRTEVTWKKKAHQYFDLLLTGGDVEKFWKELLKEAN